VRRWTGSKSAITFGVLGALSACSAISPDPAVVARESVSIGADESDSVIPRPDVSTSTDGRQTPVDAGPVDAGPVDTGPIIAGSSDEPLTDEEVAQILADLVDQGFCDPVDVEDEGAVTAMHFVVRGEIQDPCYVDQLDDDITVDPVVIDNDPRLLAAWDVLVEVAPIELVDDISLLAGFEPCSDCDSLAFVTQLDVEGTFVLLAVDVAAATDDPEELRLTMLHELSHVFAQAPGEQLAVSSGPSGCDTFYNGVGCLTEDSYLWAWIQEFWPADVVAALPSDGSLATDDEAEQRCNIDPAYTGSYAARHPEEDFAETFSAYVFDVEVDPALTPKLDFFDRYPEFVAIRESARAAGYAGTPANFEGCGP
jgi:hypothetical protein